MEDREQRTEQLSLMLGYILCYSMLIYVCFYIMGKLKFNCKLHIAYMHYS